MTLFLSSIQVSTRGELCAFSEMTNALRKLRHCYTLPMLKEWLGDRHLKSRFSSSSRWQEEFGHPYHGIHDGVCLVDHGCCPPRHLFDRHLGLGHLGLGPQTVKRCPMLHRDDMLFLIGLVRYLSIGQTTVFHGQTQHLLIREDSFSLVDSIHHYLLAKPK